MGAGLWIPFLVLGISQVAGSRASDLLVKKGYQAVDPKSGSSDRIESGGQEGNLRSRRVWISEPVPKNEAKDRRPALGGSELLRNLPDSLKECAHGFQSTGGGRGPVQANGDS